MSKPDFVGGVSLPSFSDDLAFREEDYESPYSVYSKLFVLIDSSTISHYEARFKLTNNPLYVWGAIKYCRTEFSCRHKKQIKDIRKIFLCEESNAHDDDRFSMKAYAEAAAQFASDMSFILLPDWCQDYLGNVAKKIWELRTSEKRELEPQRWIKKIPRDFGFIKPGWNAFSAYFSHHKSTMALRRYKWLVEDGASTSEARQMLLDKYGLADERSLFRLFEKGRPLLEGKPSAKVTKPKA